MCNRDHKPLPVISAAYWRTAADELKNVRVLAFSGLICAFAIILESFPIYLMGHSLKILFSFLVVGLGCACYGPVVGMAAGAVIDTVGFLLAGYGEPYFPGYLITAMLSGLIYGVMLYRRRPTVLRLIITRLLIDFGSNVLLGSVWKAMLYGKGYLYYLTTGIVKNTILLPLEVVLMWLVLSAAEKRDLDRRFLHNRPGIH
ncbi:MAG: folate family ECF transporter S component [Gemmiger sp.]|uniref:folate family ECF transporter S component n=1 Tax=Gemmiger sp. TaxID=2049027 RepID=UPI002E75C692|nr:folate family ECF transporter S component [Gemmiger sp.]MEE0800106.1 folate family ECF transporter S component [Gemmiger sp.]